MELLLFFADAEIAQCSIPVPYQ